MYHGNDIEVFIADLIDDAITVDKMLTDRVVIELRYDAPHERLSEQQLTQSHDL
jgi:hypothetical protein